MTKRLRELLSRSLSPADLAQVCNSYDIIGDIAVLRLANRIGQPCATIAEAVIKTHKNVRIVLAQVGAVESTFRLRKLVHVAGEERVVTVHREHGCRFSVDIRECYFSPRLGHERLRVAEQVQNGEVVVNMFAGVGCFSILIARHSHPKRVYSIDISPVAIRYMRENVRLNGVYGTVIPLLGDSKEVIEARLRHVADRVLMPLPEKASEYLPHALLALKTSGGWVHYYDFEHVTEDDDPVRKIKAKVAEKLSGIDVEAETVTGRIVRSTGPNWYQVALDIAVKPLVDKFNK